VDELLQHDTRHGQFVGCQELLERRSAFGVVRHTGQMSLDENAGVDRCQVACSHLR
jgi:hypothetical protein